jgi:hypothetical protein
MILINKITRLINPVSQPPFFCSRLRSCVRPFTRLLWKFHFVDEIIFRTLILYLYPTLVQLYPERIKISLRIVACDQHDSLLVVSRIFFQAPFHFSLNSNLKSISHTFTIVLPVISSDIHTSSPNFDSLFRSFDRRCHQEGLELSHPR